MNKLPQRTLLHQTLIKCFNEEELRDFCFYLQLDYDSLPGEGNAGKAREFIAYLERHNRIPELVEIGSQLRPDISWLSLIGREERLKLKSKPSEIRITPPSEGLDPKLAAFSGHWGGHWGGILPSELIVERIDSDAAIVIYIWGDHPSGKFSKGWLRIRAKAFPSGIIEWGKKVKFTFEVNADKDVIYGTREENKDVARIIMERKNQ